MSVTTLDRVSSLQRAKTPFAGAVLICGKCVRRMGPKGKQIRKALKKAVKRRPEGKVRMIETGCFSLCPKGRVVLASVRTLHERRLLMVQPDFSAAEALDHLLGEVQAS
jgi:hypothetical protein